MPFKRNPMRAERICSLARFVAGLTAIAAQTAATQWLERSLDDSAARRLTIPQAFLGADAILRLVLNVVGGLEVRPAVIERNVARSLPFLATEDLLLAAVAKGRDRQDVHELIRVHAQEAATQLKSGKADNTLIGLLRADPAFAGIDFGMTLDPKRFVGRAPEQVIEFIRGVVRPIRDRYIENLEQTASIEV